MSKGTEISRFLPNDEYQAATQANTPSSTNVYATMDDIPVVPASINGIEIKNATGAVVEPETQSLQFTGSINATTPGGNNSPVTIHVGAITAPATATSTGTVGTIAFDANYVYVCIGANSWKRAALSIW